MAPIPHTFKGPLSSCMKGVRWVELQRCSEDMARTEHEDRGTQPALMGDLAPDAHEPGFN